MEKNHFHKTITKAMLMALYLLVYPLVGKSQTDEAKQLLLNVEKLAQLKSILSDMKDGYEILHNGYNAVQEVSQGNYSLHKLFLDNLLEVNPEVKNYYRVGEILRLQGQLLQESKRTLFSIRQAELLTSQEILYLDKVYGNLLKGTAKQLEELTQILTSASFRMSDAERLRSIDRIHANMEERLLFLRRFGSSTQNLLRLRQREKSDTEALQKLHLPKN